MPTDAPLGAESLDPVLEELQADYGSIVSLMNAIEGRNRLIWDELRKSRPNVASIMSWALANDRAIRAVKHVMEIK